MCVCVTSGFLAHTQRFKILKNSQTQQNIVVLKVMEPTVKTFCPFERTWWHMWKDRFELWTMQLWWDLMRLMRKSYILMLFLKTFGPLKEAKGGERPVVCAHRHPHYILWRCCRPCLVNWKVPWNRPGLLALIICKQGRCRSSHAHHHIISHRSTVKCLKKGCTIQISFLWSTSI